MAEVLFKKGEEMLFSKTELTKSETEALKKDVSKYSKIIAVVMGIVIAANPLLVRAEEAGIGFHSEKTKESVEIVTETSEVTEVTETEESTESKEVESGTKTEETAVNEVKSLTELVKESTMEGDINSSNKFATQRLIVVSNNNEFDKHDACSVTNFKNIFVLSYDTVDKTKEAYNALLEDKSIESVDIDAVVETESVNGETSSNENTLIRLPSEFNNYVNSFENKKTVKIAMIDSGYTGSNKRIDIENATSLIDEDEKNYRDDNGHGTSLSELILDLTTENISILPIKVANKNGQATTLDVYAAINYAVKNNADIINISLNSPKNTISSILNEAISEANSNGVKVVVSAGNTNTDVSNVAPANCEDALVIASTNYNKEKAAYSNFGSTIDYSTYGSWENKSGTSYSAAYFSACLGELLSSSKTLDDLDQFVEDLGDKGWDKEYGKGFISLVDYKGLVEDNDTDDFKRLMYCDIDKLSDEELIRLANKTEPLELGYILVHSTKEQHERLINTIDFLKDCSLKDEYNYEGNNIEWTSVEEDPVHFEYYYEYLEKLDMAQLDMSTSQKYKATSGYFYMQPYYNGDAQKKYKITASVSGVTTGTESTSSKNVSASVSASSGTGTNVTITSASVVDGKTKKDPTGNYNIIVFSLSGAKPKSSLKLGSSSTSKTLYPVGEENRGRFNGNSYTQSGTSSTSTWPDSRTSDGADTTWNVKFQSNICNLGLTHSSTSKNATSGSKQHNEIHPHFYQYAKSVAYNTDNKHKYSYKVTSGDSIKATGSVIDTTSEACSYGTPTYTWAASGTTYTCTAKRTCSVCSHVQSQNGTVTSTIIKEATCIAEGSKKFTATFTNSAFSTQTKTVAIAKTAHTYSTNFTTDKAATCTVEGSKSKHCTRSGCTAKTSVTSIPALGHSYSTSYTVTKEPTCTETGTKSYKCTRTGCTAEKTEPIPALGHDYNSYYEYDWHETCTSAGQKSRHCSRCDAITDSYSIPALGHDMKGYLEYDWYETCTSTGQMSEHCSRCSYKTNKTTIPALGHNYKVTSVTNGLKENCTRCSGINNTITFNNLITTYNGTAKSITPTVSSGWVSPYSISYKDANGNTVTPVNAGTYTATITATDSSSAKASTSAILTINKATPSFSIAQKPFTNIGETKDYEITTNSPGNITATCNRTTIAEASCSGKTLSLTGKKLGICKVTLNLEETENYKAATKTATVEVYPPGIVADINTIEATLTNKIVTYDKLPHTVTESGRGEETAQYSADGDNWQDTLPTFSEIGTYEIYGKYELNGAMAYRTATLTINRASSSGLTIKPDQTTFTYDGSGHMTHITVDGLTEGEDYTVYYGPTSSSAAVDTTYSYTDSGSYKVYYRVEFKNYTTATGSFTMVINKATGYVNTANSYTVCTDYAKHEYSYDASGSVNVSSSNSSVATAEVVGDKIVVTGRSVGTTNIVISVLEATNYKATTVKVPVTVTEHNYGEWATVKEPTYLAKGEKERNCKICNHKDTADIIPLSEDKAPETTVEALSNSWNKFLNTITFGLFSKNTETVKITVREDSLCDEITTGSQMAQSGVRELYYYISNKAITETNIKSSSISWTKAEMVVESTGKYGDEVVTAKFDINPDNKYVVYVKAIDNCGNIKYVSTDGLVLDATAPSVTLKVGSDTYTTVGNPIEKDWVEKDITVTGSDNLTQTKLYYYFADSKLKDVTADNIVWKEVVGGKITMPEETFILYVKAEDQAGNATYAASDYYVYAKFTITIPKKIELDDDGTGEYAIKVNATLGSDSYISVVPDNAFTLKEKTSNKTVTTTVSQKVRNIYCKLKNVTLTSQDILCEKEKDYEIKGTLSAKDISAGSWKGTFRFTVTLNK